MKTRFIQHFVVLILIFSSIAGCGGEDRSTPAPRNTTQIVPTSGTGGENTDDPAPVDNATQKDITEVLYTGSAVSIPVKLPDPYDHDCAKGDGIVSWTIVGDASKISISDPKTCRPTIGLASALESAGSVSALFRTKNMGLRYVIQLKVVDPVQCTAAGGNPEGDLCIYTICSTAVECARLAITNTYYYLDGRAVVAKDYASTNATGLCEKNDSRSKLVDFKTALQAYQPPYRFNTNYIIEFNRSGFGTMPLNNNVRVELPVLSKVRCSK